MAARRNVLLVVLAAALVAAATVPTASASVQAHATPSPPNVGGCHVFPANNAWNQDVSKFPVRFDSLRLVRTISKTGGRTLQDAAQLNGIPDLGHREFSNGESAPGAALE